MGSMQAEETSKFSFNQIAYCLCCFLFLWNRAFTIISIKYSGAEPNQKQFNGEREGLVMAQQECSLLFLWLLYLGIYSGYQSSVNFYCWLFFMSNATSLTCLALQITQLLHMQINVSMTIFRVLLNLAVVRTDCSNM